MLLKLMTPSFTDPLLLSSSLSLFNCSMDNTHNVKLAAIFQNKHYSFPYNDEYRIKYVYFACPTTSTEQQEWNS